jgi:hypothetical protein
MHYTRRPTRPDQPARRDYIIRREDLQIGRVYLTNTPYGDRFVWSITIPKVPGVSISGWAETLDKATAAMLKSYGQMRAKAGLPRPQPTNVADDPASSSSAGDTTD